MRARRFYGLLVAALITGGVVATAGPGTSGATPGGSGPPVEVRFATFNASLNRNAAGQLVTDLSTPGNAQAATVAEIIQRARPDVLLINEFDFVPGGVAARLFQDNYLSVPHNGAPAIHYPYRYVAPSNTGIPSGLDLNNDGTIGGADDAFGFGFFPGQFGMAVYSMHPIVLDDVRTFQTFRWADMPGALLPDDPSTPAPADWFTPEELAQVRLSSKSHWDLPIDVDGRIVHFLVSHPTPPVFDGPEDRNGRRNHDEIRLWADYLTGGKAAEYIRDDAGKAGPMAADAAFVILGDLNAEPVRGDTVEGKRPIELLLKHPRVTDPRPKSEGGTEADGPDLTDYKPYRSHGFGRLDYVLPSKGLKVLDCGVFWPKKGEPLRPLINPPDEASDHRPVWVDLAVPAGR